MKFRTEIKLPEYPFRISYTDRIMFVGSCFSDNIGRFFEENGFDVSVNPFGTLFNPISIAFALKLAMNPSLFDERLVVNNEGLWHSFAHHGRFSDSNRQKLMETVGEQLSSTHDFLLKSDFLFLTFGTSYVYRYIKEGFVVANCHKIPAYEFDKERITVETIVSEYKNLISELKKTNAKLKIVFTVSPVRHLGDGFHENQLSKSVLHLAIDELCGADCYYFPSYEVFQDDLRDYRFYAQDLCHPSEAGVRYLEEIIVSAFFTAETEARRKEIEKQNKAAAHIPNNTSYRK